MTAEQRDHIRRERDRLRRQEIGTRYAFDKRYYYLDQHVEELGRIKGYHGQFVAKYRWDLAAERAGLEPGEWIDVYQGGTRPGGNTRRLLGERYGLELRYRTARPGSYAWQVRTAA